MSRRSDLHGADLHGADLRWTDLYRTDMRSADLTGADLRWTDMRSADLTGADLRSADLTGADMRNANLHGADLEGADLEGADLEGTCLEGTCMARLLGDDGRGFAVIAHTGHASETVYYVGCRALAYAAAVTHWGDPGHSAPASAALILGAVEAHHRTTPKGNNIMSTAERQRRSWPKWISADVGAGGRMNTDVRIVSAVAGPVWSARSMLSRALELVQVGWCQHEQARDAGRGGLQPDDPNATAWSLDGAINLACAEAVAEVTEFDRFNETGDGPAKRAQCLAERERLVDALETAIAAAERKGTPHRFAFVAYPSTELSYWNDATGRTQEDVICLCQTVLAELGAS